DYVEHRNFAFSIMVGPWSTAPVTVADQLLAYLAGGEDRDYIGESVSQLAHALQAADRARRARAAREPRLAALFPDVGHPVAARPPPMDRFARLHHPPIR